MTCLVVVLQHLTERFKSLGTTVAVTARKEGTLVLKVTSSSDPGYGSGMIFRTRAVDPDSVGSLDPYSEPDSQSEKFINKSAGRSLLRAECLSCSLDGRPLWRPWNK
jgi:hypothetical protein